MRSLLAALVAVVAMSSLVDAQVARVVTLDHETPSCRDGQCQGMLQTRSYGSAVCVARLKSKETVWLTAAHVVKDAQQIHLTIEGQERAARLDRYQYRNGVDLAVLVCEKWLPREQIISTYEEAYRGPVVIVGCPNGSPHVVANYGTWNGQEVVGANPIEHGISGGGMFVRGTKQLVGIVTSRQDPSEGGDPRRGYISSQDTSRVDVSLHSFVMESPAIASRSRVRQPDCSAPLPNYSQLFTEQQSEPPAANSLIAVVPYPQCQCQHASAKDVASYLIEHHADDLRGMDGEGVDVEQLAAYLLEHHREDLRGERGADGKYVSVADVSRYLIANHREQLRGEQGPPGPKGEQGFPGPKGEQGERGLVAVPDDDTIRKWFASALDNPEVQQLVISKLGEIPQPMRLLNPDGTVAVEEHRTLLDPIEFQLQRPWEK